MFNESKTQLICFRSFNICRFLPVISFNNITLHYSNQVQHLGHILSYNLSDTADILCVLKEINRKANATLCLVHFADPFVSFMHTVWHYTDVPCGHSSKTLGAHAQRGLSAH